MATLNSRERYRLSEEKTKNWLKTTVDPEDYADIESISSSAYDSTDTESGEEQQLGIQTNTNKTSELENGISNQLNSVMNLNFIQTKLQQLATSTNYSNICITNSSDILLGNIYNFNNDLTINVTKNENGYNNSVENGNTIISKNEAFTKPACPILPRKIWMIKEPKEMYSSVEIPVKLVLISHTATTSSTEQTINIDLIRDIQSFHVDTNGWNDIAYNFLIGGDGNIYEGRGWDVEGAHCFGYNNKSIGISFIGCFIRKLPTEQALKACKDLLTRGIDEGHISRDYKLLGHRQCSTTESPGTKLYEEIQTWPNFYNKSIDEDY